jgi:hypothetical protein
MLGAQTNLLVFLAVLAFLGLLGWLFRGPLVRLKNYFVYWAQADKRAEEQAKKEEAQRRQAERELREKLVEDEEEKPVQRVNR